MVFLQQSSFLFTLPYSIEFTLPFVLGGITNSFGLAYVLVLSLPLGALSPLLFLFQNFLFAAEISALFMF